MSTLLNKQPPAVVVGLCVHGLATVKSLAKKGVAVYSLTSNYKDPAVKTRFSNVHFTEDLRGPGLINALSILHGKINPATKPILFLTNDNTVACIADNWPKLENLYKLSWADCRYTVKELLLKSNIQKYCDRAGILYPKSWILDSIDGISNIPRDMKLPFIIKPVKPVSKFKAELIESADALKTHVKKYQSELPFIIQEWVPGDVSRLLFCGLYLQEGKAISRIEGYKLRSYPSERGGGSVVAPLANEIVYKQASSFFRETNLSGPVALEMKRDKNDNLWVIEPTVGRTEYWADFCVANGVDLPYVEYCDQIGSQIPQQKQNNSAIWVDIDKDPSAFIFVLKKGLIFKKKCFIFFDFNDIGPLLSFTAMFINRCIKKITRLPRESI